MNLITNNYTINQNIIRNTLGKYGWLNTSNLTIVCLDKMNIPYLKRSIGVWDDLSLQVKNCLGGLVRKGEIVSNEHPGKKGNVYWLKEAENGFWESIKKRSNSGRKFMANAYGTNRSIIRSTLVQYGWLHAGALTVVYLDKKNIPYHKRSMGVLIDLRLQVKNCLDGLVRKDEIISIEHPGKKGNAYRLRKGNDGFYNE